MNLIIHELLHIFFSLLCGFFVYKKWGQFKIAMIGAFLGGFFVDLDHLIDYFLAFGWHFNIIYFLKGYSFLQSDKIYLFLHAWEWVLLLLILYSFLLIKKIKIPQEKLMIFILVVICSLSFHLLIDTFVDSTTTKAYFLSYRIHHHFNLKPLVSPSHWMKHQIMKNKYRIIY